jgi:hypothetical protein
LRRSPDIVTDLKRNVKIEPSNICHYELRVVYALQDPFNDRSAWRINQFPRLNLA